MFVKKGTTVLYSVWALHRREDIFGPDVEEFRPERWDGLRPGWGFLPFNGGPRICLGRKLGRICTFPRLNPKADNKLARTIRFN